MRFKFKAIKENGERYEGTLESQGKFALYNELKTEGSMLISAEEITTNGFKKIFFKNFGFLGSI